MLESDSYLELFEKYRNGELGDSELRDFDARLAFDSEFNKEFEQYKSLEQDIKRHFKISLKAELKELDQSMGAPQKAKNNNLKVIVIFAAVAAVIAILFLVVNSYSKDYSQLAMKHWPYEEGLPVKMSASGKYDEVMNAFKLEEWDKAENLLLNLNSDTADYFLGMVSYEQKKFPKAINYFEKITKNSVFWHESQFRSSLLLLQESPDLGKGKLKEIAKSNSTFKNEAATILKEL